MSRLGHERLVRLALLTFVMLASPALAADMTDPSHDFVLLGASHEAEVATDAVDLLSGSIMLEDGAYVAVLRFVDLAAAPSDDHLQFHAEANFRADGARYLASLTFESDGDVFVVGYKDFQPTVPTTATYDAEAESITFRMAAPDALAAPTAAGANAALFHCLDGRGCSRAVLGPETGFAILAVQDTMGASQGDAFVRGGL